MGIVSRFSSQIIRMFKPASWCGNNISALDFKSAYVVTMKHNSPLCQITHLVVLIDGHVSLIVQIAKMRSSFAWSTLFVQHFFSLLLSAHGQQAMSSTLGTIWICNVVAS